MEVILISGSVLSEFVEVFLLSGSVFDLWKRFSIVEVFYDLWRCFVPMSRY